MSALHRAWILDQIARVEAAQAASYPETKYIVVNENCLGYTDDLTVPFQMGVLQGSVARGGPDWRNGPVFVTSSDQFRPATLKDFEDYRVSPKGHIA